MIVVINFLIKIVTSILCMLMFWLNLIIVIIMWDGKFMVVFKLLDLIWDKPKQCNIHVVVKSFYCNCDSPDITWYGNEFDKKYFCFNCKKEVN